MAKKGCTTESTPVIKCFNTTICYFEHYRIQNSRTFLSTFMIFACLVSFDFDWIERWNHGAVWCYGWEKSQSKYLYNLFPASAVYERVSYYHFHEKTSSMFFHDHELYNWKLRAQISQSFFRMLLVRYFVTWQEANTEIWYQFWNCCCDKGQPHTLGLWNFLVGKKSL